MYLNSNPPKTPINGSFVPGEALPSTKTMKRAFTLLELLCAVAIVAILLSLVFNRVSVRRLKARISSFYSYRNFQIEYLAKDADSLPHGQEKIYLQNYQTYAITNGF